MEMRPVELKIANQFISQFHRHNKKVTGHKFSIGIFDGDELMGVAIVGRPVARMADDGLTLEVLRSCTKPGAPKGTNSKLYGHCKKIAQVMAYRRLITYTLTEESGSSLKAVGAVISGSVDASVGWSRQGRRRENQAIYKQEKIRWDLLGEKSNRTGGDSGRMDAGMKAEVQHESLNAAIGREADTPHRTTPISTLKGRAGVDFCLQPGILESCEGCPVEFTCILEQEEPK